jgi:alkyl hydroperoxide reductase subunit AhpC
MITEIGRPAPRFSAVAFLPGLTEPQSLTLGELPGAWLVFVFYPGDFTLACPTELQAFAALEREFEAESAGIVAVSTDSFWSHKAWFESHPLLASVRYPVLADTSHRICAAFGVLSPDGTPLRATFVVDPTGIVRHVSISDQGVSRSPDETLRVLRALREQERKHELR